MLNHRQRSYDYRLLSLPDQHPAKEILLVSLRAGDESFQPGELPINTLKWTEDTRPPLYGQWLAWQLTTEHSINPANGVEPVPVIGPDFRFRGEIIIQHKKQALVEATRHRNGLVMWTDGSKLDQGNAGDAICWKTKRLDRWKDKSVFLGKNKEIIDAELWAILEALIVATKEIQNTRGAPITVFCDSQKGLIAIQHTRLIERTGS